MAWWRLVTYNLKPSFSQKTLLPLPKVCISFLVKCSDPIPTNPFSSTLFTRFSTSFLATKTPQKFKKPRKKDSPRTKPIQPDFPHLSHFERIVARDNELRFLIRSKQFLSKQPDHILRLDDAGKLFREMGFSRGQKINKFVAKHPLIFEIYRHTDNKMWIGFTEFMERLLEEEKRVMESMENERVKVVKKLLMMCKDRRMPLSKIYHCRLLFGIPEDFRDWVLKYPGDFQVSSSADGTRMLELAKWDEKLAMSALEREFMVDEEKVKRAFKFPVKHGKALDLDLDDERRLNLLNALPLVSPYSDGWKHDLWTLEAEKYRVGILHEFLNLTLEKRASIHHIVEFKEEFSLTKHTFQMLSKQRRTFYLAGTEMNWSVFLRDAYDENGELTEKDPQVIFNDKLYTYARMQEQESSSVIE